MPDDHQMTKLTFKRVKQPSTESYNINFFENDTQISFPEVNEREYNRGGAGKAIVVPNGITSIKLEITKFEAKSNNTITIGIISRSPHRQFQSHTFGVGHTNIRKNDVVEVSVDAQDGQIKTVTFTVNGRDPISKSVEGIQDDDWNFSVWFRNEWYGNPIVPTILTLVE